MPGLQQMLSKYLCNAGVTSWVTEGIYQGSNEEEVVWGQETFLVCGHLPPPLRFLGGDWKDWTWPFLWVALTMSVKPKTWPRPQAFSRRVFSLPEPCLWPDVLTVKLKPQAPDSRWPLPRPWEGLQQGVQKLTCSCEICQVRYFILFIFFQTYNAFIRD